MNRHRFALVPWVAAGLLVGCGGAGGPGPDQRQKYEEFECPAPIGKIFREDCDKSALQYQGESFQGSVGAAGVGASAEYRQTAIREADALVQLLKEERTSLCNNFNTCKMTVAEYREEQKQLDDSFVALMALKDKMAAMDAQGASLLLEELRKIRSRAQDVKAAQPAASGSAAPAAPVPAAPPASTTATASTSTAPGPNEGLLPDSIPTDRSPLPKTADWDGANALTVPGTSTLGCEVKLSKEWIRVSCRGANDSGGTPSAVEAQGCGNDAYTFANPRTKVASVVMPVVKGRKCQAVFSWTDKKKTFVLDWSTGKQARASFE